MENRIRAFRKAADLRQEDLARELGFSGYGQERTSAREEYTPAFDLRGI